MYNFGYTKSRVYDTIITVKVHKRRREKYPLIVMEKKFVLYSEFGAVGDGVANDFNAIKKAHDYANENGLDVKADAGKTYYIGRTYGEKIAVKTNTDWCGSNFVIDDRCFAVEDPDREAPIFVLTHDEEPVEYTSDSEGAVGDAIRAINAAGGLVGENKTKLDLGLGHPALVFIFNENRRTFIRYGENEDAGSAQREVVLVDEEGNIKRKTPVYFDYEEITRVRIVSSEESAIKVGNGIFTTVANAAPRQYTYYARGINIERSNATLYGIDFRITGEGDTGAPYEGSIGVFDAYNVVVRDCIVTAHKAYKLEGSDKNTMGTYGLVAGKANKITFKNVTMHNFFAPGTQTPSVYAGYWGIMGSNYCKNITYDTCKLTRFDAHCGTYHAKILNSDIGTLTLIGNGTFKIENSRVFCNRNACLVTLRPDYGSTWCGKFVLNNVTAIPSSEMVKEEFALIQGWHVNWDFGYKCYMPETVTVKNFKVEAPSVKRITLISGTITKEGVSIDTVDGVKNINPYTVSKELVVEDNQAGYEYVIPKGSDYKRIKITHK